MGYMIGVDIGGTHTDCVLLDGDRVEVAKVQTTLDPTDGVFNGIEALARDYGSSAELLSNCDRFLYGSTTATNLFVQHRLPKVGLLCTKGHRDSLWFRDGYKPDRWNLRLPPLWTPIPRYLRCPVEERMNYRGDVLTPLNEADVHEAAQYLKDQKVEAVAVCFLWSFVNPAHEGRAKEILVEDLQGVPVVTSYETLPVIREWERTYCTCLSAGIIAEVKKHLEALRNRLRELGFKREPLVMQCNGGYSTIDQVLKTPLYLVASGPAGGTLAALMYGELTDAKDVMSIDTGGTSCDVCVLSDGSIPITKNKRLEYEPIAVPSVEIHTIGAGGGSIAWIDAGGALHVGPHSAGAHPGPACYGTGGEEPTVTDAYLMLGYLDPNFFLGGRFRLDPTLAEKALGEKIAKPLGVDLLNSAWDIFEISANHQADALRLLSVQRGIDPSPYKLIAGGGAGPVQAGIVAELVGIRRILIPRMPGAFCVLGTLWGNLKHDRLTTYAVLAAEVVRDKMLALYKEMEESLIEQLGEEGVPRERCKLRRFVDARYKGQVFEIETEVPLVDKFEPEHITEIVSRFEDLHDRFYYYRMEGAHVEFVTLRSEATGEVKRIKFREFPHVDPDPSRALKGKRKVYSPKKRALVEVNIYDAQKLSYGNVIDEFAIVETEGSTLCVWENERLTVNKWGDFELEVIVP